MAKLLEVESLRAGYGSINVLWDLSLTVAEGKLTCILGPNGGGKTTLLRAIMGLVKTDAGSVRYRGVDSTNVPTWTMVRNGIAMIPEGRMVFRDMSVADNLLMGAFPPKCRARSGANLKLVYDMFPRLYERRDQMAGALSGGEAQMLAMGRGIMEEPELILVDEPLSALDPTRASQAICALTQAARERGASLVTTLHHVDMALAHFPRIIGLRDGELVFDLPSSQVTPESLRTLYAQHLDELSAAPPLASFDSAAPVVAMQCR